MLQHGSAEGSKECWEHSSAAGKGGERMGSGLVLNVVGHYQKVRAGETPSLTDFGI